MASCAALLLAALLPGLANAGVAKAFGRLGSETKLDPAAAGSAVNISLIGDDDAAKARAVDLVRRIGLVPVDAGPLRYARVIESQHHLRYNGGLPGNPFAYYLLPE